MSDEREEEAVANISATIAAALIFAGKAGATTYFWLV